MDKAANKLKTFIRIYSPGAGDGETA